MGRVWLLIVMMAVVALGLPGTASAQPVTPTNEVGTPGPEGDMPAPEDCLVEPRSLENLQSLIATPVAEATVDAVGTPGVAPTLPAGEPVDDETVEAIRAAIHEAIACSNAGNLPAFLAFYSDALVQRLLGPMGALTEEEYQSLINDEPWPEEMRTVIISYGEAALQPDGRVAILIEGNDLSDPRPASFTLFYFIEEDGRWLIDEFVTTPDE